jgi:uncharacterized protein (DUF362 family)
MDRRKFLTILTAGAALLMAGKATEGAGEGAILPKPGLLPNNRLARISLVKTRDRETGIRRAIDLLEINPVQGKDVLLKPNFNSADPFPASTHNDALTQLILQLKKMGSKNITIGERSGIPRIGDVLKNKGIYDLCRNMDVGLINFEDLSESGWVHMQPKQSHWLSGFDVAKPVMDSSCIVTTCCLKTHAYGGVFTMSLKLSVGCIRDANMLELHTSLLSIQKMIAEINLAYQPALILLDGIDAFVDRGPSHGPIKQADVILAGTDRIAIDAAGLAVLKHVGSNRAIMEKKIFEQGQIARAVELGLGISRPENIEIVTDDAAGKDYAEKLKRILLQG